MGETACTQGGGKEGRRLKVRIKGQRKMNVWLTRNCDADDWGLKWVWKGNYTTSAAFDSKQMRV